MLLFQFWSVVVTTLENRSKTARDGRYVANTDRCWDGKMAVLEKKSFASYQIFDGRFLDLAHSNNLSVYIESKPFNGRRQYTHTRRHRENKSARLVIPPTDSFTLFTQSFLDKPKDDSLYCFPLQSLIYSVVGIHLFLLPYFPVVRW